MAGGGGGLVKELIALCGFQEDVESARGVEDVQGTLGLRGLGLRRCLLGLWRLEPRRGRRTFEGHWNPGLLLCWVEPPPLVPSAVWRGGVLLRGDSGRPGWFRGVPSPPPASLALSPGDGARDRGGHGSIGRLATAAGPGNGCSGGSGGGRNRSRGRHRAAVPAVPGPATAPTALGGWSGARRPLSRRTPPLPRAGAGPLPHLGRPSTPQGGGAR